MGEFIKKNGLVFAIIAILLACSGAYTSLKQGKYIDAHFPAFVPFEPLFEKGIAIMLTLAVIVLVSSTVSNLIEQMFSKVLKNNALGKKILPILKTIGFVFVWVFGILFILKTVGIDISALLTGAWVWGFLLVLAGKEAASNLIGSLSLVFSKHFLVGDTIRVKQNFEGKVEEITLSSTTLRDKKGNLIHIPNKLLISEIVENLSVSKIKKIEIPFILPSSIPPKTLSKVFTDIIKTLEKSKLESIEITIESFSAENTTYALKCDIPANVECTKQAIALILQEKLVKLWAVSEE